MTIETGHSQLTWIERIYGPEIEDRGYLNLPYPYCPSLLPSSSHNGLFLNDLLGHYITECKAKYSLAMGSEIIIEYVHQGTN